MPEFSSEYRFFGVAFKNDYSSAELSIIDFSLHYHSNPDYTPCKFIAGFQIGLMGFHMAVGIFKDSE